MKNMPKDSKREYLLKLILVGAVALIAVSLFVYVLRQTRTRSTFEACYEECIKLGWPPVNGKCEEGYYKGVRKTDKGEWKKGDPWCYTNAGKCLVLCRGK